MIDMDMELEPSLDFDYRPRTFSFNSMDYDVEKIATHCGCKATRIIPDVNAFMLQPHSGKKESVNIFILDAIFPYTIPQEFLNPTFDTFNTFNKLVYVKFPSIECIMVAIPWFKTQGDVLEVFRDEYMSLLAEVRRVWEASNFSMDDAPELSSRKINLLLMKYPSQIVESVIRYFCDGAPCTLKGLGRLSGTETYSTEELAELGAAPLEIFVGRLSIPIVEEIEDGVYIFYEDNYKDYYDEVVKELHGN